MPVTRDDHMRSAFPCEPDDVVVAGVGPHVPLRHRVVDPDRRRKNGAAQGHYLGLEKDRRDARPRENVVQLGDQPGRDEELEGALERGPDDAARRPVLTS